MSIVSLWVFLFHCLFTFLCPAPQHIDHPKVLAVQVVVQKNYSVTVTPTQMPKLTHFPIPKPSSNNLLDKINTYRKSQGLGPVATNPLTCDFAQVRAQEISSNFNHDGFNQRLASHNLPYKSYSLVTENIAETSSNNPIEMWIASPGHAANMRADTPFVCVMQFGNYYAYEGLKP